MAANNPLSLAAKKTAGPPARAVRKVWTDAEIEDRLRGYAKVPPELWRNIRNGTHVRYRLTNGEFRGGGFIRTNPIDRRATADEEPNEAFLLQSGFTPMAKGYLKWAVSYSEISELWMKSDAGLMQIQKQMDDCLARLKQCQDQINREMERVHENMKKLTSFIQKLAARLDALERAQRS